VTVRWLAAACLVGALAAGCGKKGPPLPPLVRLPVAPADLSAERRGGVVDLRFTVPAANTDGSRPGDIERVDVYGLTGPPTSTDADVIRHGTLVASVEVKAPADPDLAADADEVDADIEPPVGPGLEQGATTHVFETLTPERLETSGPDGQAPPPALLAPTPAARTYLAVGISTRGRRGPGSTRASVLLTAPPPPPSQPVVAYDLTGATIGWKGAASPATASVPTPGALESRALFESIPARAYHVYEVVPSAALTPGVVAPAETRLTKEPVAGETFLDARIELGRERCYVVRTVETLGGLSVESEASPPACRLFADVFPPAAPVGLTSVPSGGAVNLIWDPNKEPDLAGYLVLRGDTPATLKALTPAPIQETRFRDTVEAGQRYVYAVQAIDAAGNTSGLSSTVEEFAR
jgi:predicted small lipoprotein YifL